MRPLILGSDPPGLLLYTALGYRPLRWKALAGSLNSGKLAITPISPFRPRKWKGKVVSNNSTIKITNLDPKKRPIAAVADNIETRNIKSLSVKVNKKIKLTLLYDSKHSLEKRINLERTKY